MKFIFEFKFNGFTAYGPLSGGLVCVLKICPGPISVFFTVVNPLPLDSISFSYGAMVDDEISIEYWNYK